MPDERSYRVALVADRYVNPGPGQFDGLAVLAAAGWGAMQLPDDAYPAEVAGPLLAEVAEQAEEFSRRGYALVLVGERDGLAEALALVLALPRPTASRRPARPSSASSWPACRPGGYSCPGISSRPPVASVSTRQKVPVRSEASISAERVAVTYSAPPSKAQLVACSPRLISVSTSPSGEITVTPWEMVVATNSPPSAAKAMPSGT